MRRRAAAVSAVLAAALALAACTTAHRTTAHRTTAHRSTAPAGQFAASSVTTTHDGHAVVYALAGGRWTTVPLPRPPADDDAVAGHGSDIYVATLDTRGVGLEYSGDGGRTWHSRRVARTRDVAGIDLARSADGGRLAITLDRPGSVGAVGQASVLVGPTSGGAFTSRIAPAAGHLAWWRGRLALSGGPLSSRLYLGNAAGSAWTPVRVRGRLAPVRNVDPATPSIGRPLVRKDGALLVPVTNHAAAPGVDLLATRDGVAFRTLGHVALRGRLGAGTNAPVAVRPDGSIVVSDPDTLRFTVLGEASFVPKGLPAPPSRLMFATPALGLAQIDQAGCADGKTGCSVRTRVFATSDGGRTWHPAP